MRAPKPPISRGSMCATLRAAWCRSARSARSSRSSGPRRCPITTITARPSSMAARRRAIPRARRSPRWSVRRDRAARDFGYEWTGITFQELKAGSVATVVFGLALVFVFLILAAQYESWTMPFMVLLAVPLALFGALQGFGCAAYPDRRLFADRLRDADRPLGEERHPDRRIREAPARGGLSISRPRWMPRSFGFARS